MSQKKNRSTPLHPTPSRQQHSRTDPSLIRQRSHPRPRLRVTILLPIAVDIRRERDAGTRIISTAIRQAALQRLSDSARQRVAPDIMVAAHLVRLGIGVREGLVVVARAQLHQVEGIARRDVERLGGAQRGVGAGGELGEDVVRVAVDGQGVGFIGPAARVRDARDVAQDVAELEAFFPRVGVHGFGVAAQDVHAAANLPGLAEEVGVDGAVLAGAAEGLTDARGREGVDGGRVLGGAGLRISAETNSNSTTKSTQSTVASREGQGKGYGHGYSRCQGHGQRYGQGHGR